MAFEPETPRNRPLWPALALVAAAVAAWSNSFGVPFLLDDGPAIAANPSIRDLGKWGQILWPEIDGGATTAGRPLVNASLALNWGLSGERVWSYHAVNLAVHVAAGLLLWGVVRRLFVAADCGVRNADCGVRRGNREAEGPGAPAPSYRGVGQSARERERERIAGNPAPPGAGYRTAGAEVSGSTEKSPGAPAPGYREKEVRDGKNPAPPGAGYREKGAEVAAAGSSAEKNPGAPAPGYRAAGAEVSGSTEKSPGAPAPGYRTAGAEVSGSTEKSPGAPAPGYREKEVRDGKNPAPPGAGYREKGAEVAAAGSSAEKNPGAPAPGYREKEVRDGKNPAPPGAGYREKGAEVGAFFVAAIWMLHPLQTAAVTYIVQRAEAMAAMWVLLTVYAFQRFAGVGRSERVGDAGGTTAEQRGERERLRERERFLGWRVVSVGACLCGMATKETAVVAPLIVFLYDRTFVAGSFAAAWRARRGYYLALAATWGLLAVLVIGNAGRGGTAGFGTVVTPAEYFLTQCGAIVQYLRLAIWPNPLVFDYGTATVSGVGAVWWQLLLLAAAGGATGWALVKRPAWGFSGAVFFLLLAPSSSFVPVASQTMAEHRMYLALAVPVGWFAAGVVRGLGRAAVVVLAVVAVAAGAATFARNRDYATAEGLWTDTIAKRPGNPRAHHNLGLAKLAAGDAAGAERHLRDALALAPKSPESHYNLALVLVRQGRPEEAMGHYRESLALEPAQAAAHNNLANLLLAAGRTEEAGRHYAEAVRVQPDFAGARNSHGNWLLLAGRPAEALAEFEAALRVDAGTAELRFNAGNACAALGRFEEAAGHFREAARLDPGHAEARNNLGNVLLELDRLPEALAEFEAALRLQPDYFEPRRTLALLYLMHLDRPAEAQAHLEVLARARPGDREIREALARARRPLK